jgi:hypothetical protein
MNLLLSILSKLLFLALAVALVSSCKDDEAPSSKRPLLVDKTWIIVKYEMDGEDFTEERDECETDNTTTFFSDGTFLDNIGGTPCDEFDANVDGTWAFKGNESIISIRPSGDSPSDWNILELTNSKLRISQYVAMFEAEVVVEMAPL